MAAAHVCLSLSCFLAVLPLARVQQALASRSLSPCHLPGSSQALSLVSLQGFFFVHVKNFSVVKWW